MALRPQDVPEAWRKYYARLARHFMNVIGKRRPGVVLEAGAGRGQLTIPMLGMLSEKAKMIAVDSSKGPYAGWLKELGMKVKAGGLEKRVRLINADVKKIRAIQDESVDIVVSNELLCDLPYDSELENAVQEFRRILRPGGLMVHGEWASAPPVEPQAFLVKHWPSWTPDQLFSITRKQGFHAFQVSYFDTTIHFGYESAIVELRTWGADDKFLKRHEKLLRQEGLELPFEHVVQCEK